MQVPKEGKSTTPNRNKKNIPFQRRGASKRTARSGRQRSINDQFFQRTGAMRVIGPPRMQRQVGRLPFDGIFEARLPYMENFAINASGMAGTTTSQYTFYLNNMYDPRVQVGGHQPMQYDLLASVFNRYLVHDVHVCIQFSNPTADGLYVGYRVRQGSNAVTTTGQTLDYIQEMSNVQVQAVNDTGTQVVTMRFRLNIADLYGLPRLTPLIDNSFSGAFDGSYNPSSTRLVYLEPFALSTSGNDIAVRCNVSIEYHARCTELETYPQS